MFRWGKERVVWRKKSWKCLTIPCTFRPQCILIAMATAVEVFGMLALVHCPKNNLNLRIKTEPVTVGADVWYLGQMHVNKSCSYTTTSDQALTGWVFYAEIQI